MMGIYGPLAFIAPMQGGLLLNKFSKTSKTRWEAHKLYGQVPQQEFVGQDLVKASIRMKFLRGTTTDPAAAIIALDFLQQGALPMPFLLGGIPVSARGASLFVIEQIETNVSKWAGSIMLCTETTIELEEYPLSIAAAIQNVISSVSNVASQIGL